MSGAHCVLLVFILIPGNSSNASSVLAGKLNLEWISRIDTAFLFMSYCTVPRHATVALQVRSSMILCSFLNQERGLGLTSLEYLAGSKDGYAFDDVT